MSKKLVVTIMLLVIFFAVASLCCLFAYLIITLTSGGYFNGVQKTSIKNGSSSQTVAVIDINEVISSQQGSDILGNKSADMATRTNAKLQNVIDDDNIKAVLLRMNTPGGEVYATREIYNKIQEVKQKGKKVVVLMEDETASGGYYIAAGADHIVASEMTLTGSIGVIFDSLDMTGLYDKVGLKQIDVTNTKGTLKVLKDLDKPDSEGYKLLQTLADDYYDNFVGVVATGRNLTKDQVRTLADGRVYSGKQALQNHLVDELGEYSEAVEAIKKIAGLDNPNMVLLEDQQNSFSGFGVTLLNYLNPLSSLTNRLAQSGTGVKAMYLLQY
jgi:protease-4